MDIKIIKETSKYNKSMKYHLIETTAAGGKMGSWYKTQKDAEYAKTRRKNSDPDHYVRFYK